MSACQKIYIHNKPLVLTTSSEHFIANHPAAANYLLLKGAVPQHFLLAQTHLEEDRNAGVLLEDISLDVLKKAAAATFPPVPAAGGIVCNQDGGILMIFRHGHWDLPKGKLDEGESLEHCAQREVIEETGLPSVMLGAEICQTMHVYARDGQQHLKVTHWYEMSADKAFQFYPQKEEGISEIRWIHPEHLGLYLNQSYEAVKDALHAAGKLGNLIS